MATMASVGKRAGRVDDLIRTAKALGLHSGGTNQRPWLTLDRLSSSLGVEPRSLAAPMASAEADGLLSIRRTESGRIAIRLTRLVVTRARRHVPVVLDDGLHDCPQADLVRAVAEMPGTAPLVEDLAERLGEGLDRICQRIAEAEAGDWLAAWADCPEGPACCLTPRSAGRLGLAISSDRSKWIRLGEPDWCDDETSREVRAADFDTRLEASRFFAGVEDPDDPPEVQVMEAEAAERRAAELDGVELPPPAPVKFPSRNPRPKRRGAWGEAGIMSLLTSESLDGTEERFIPRPKILIGAGRQWPVLAPDVVPPRPWTRADGKCPACKGEPLGPAAACLVCDAMGVQPLLDRIRFAAPAPDSVPASADSVRTLALRGGI